MAWQTEMTPLLRYVINDIDTPQTYTDSRLQNMLLVATQLLLLEVDFDKTYVVDIGNSGISPDPTDDTRDNALINLSVLKAACIVRNSEAKTYALQSIRVSDGPSSIDAGGRFTGINDLAKKACADYEHARMQYQAGNSRAGEAILGPYTNERVYPSEGQLA